MKLVADFTVQQLIEEADLAGWQRVEFPTALMNAADYRLSMVEQEATLEP